jgi:hypothetical protein
MIHQNLWVTKAARKGIIIGKSVCVCLKPLKLYLIQIIGSSNRENPKKSWRYFNKVSGCACESYTKCSCGEERSDSDEVGDGCSEELHTRQKLSKNSDKIQTKIQTKS